MKEPSLEKGGSCRNRVRPVVSRHVYSYAAELWRGLNDQTWGGRSLVDALTHMCLELLLSFGAAPLTGGQEQFGKLRGRGTTNLNLIFTLPCPTCDRQCHTNCDSDLCAVDLCGFCSYVPGQGLPEGGAFSRAVACSVHKCAQGRGLRPG
jgi:hypothetical protein